MRKIEDVINKARAIALKAEVRRMLPGAYLPKDRELIELLINGLKELAEDLENHKKWRKAELATGRHLSPRPKL